MQPPPQILTNKIQKYIKWIIHHNKVRIIKGMNARLG